MSFQAEIKIMPLKELLDPQGKAVLSGLEHLQLSGVQDVRIGKHIVLQIDADSAEAAKAVAEEAAAKLLANPVMESYEVTIL